MNKLSKMKNYNAKENIKERIIAKENTSLGTKKSTIVRNSEYKNEWLS